jgi:hypothetical protein
VIHIQERDRLVAVEKQRKRRQDEAFTTCNYDTTTPWTFQSSSCAMCLAPFADLLLRGRPRKYDIGIRAAPDANASMTRFPSGPFARRRQSKLPNPFLLLHIFVCSVGGVDHFSFFLGRSFEECPRIVFRQLVALGGCRAQQTRQICLSQ